MRSVAPPAAAAAARRAVPQPLRRALRPATRLAALPPSAAAASTGSAQAKAAEALAQLEVLKREAEASRQLRAELEARTAAMTNLQQQLEHVEKLREADAAAAAARWVLLTFDWGRCVAALELHWAGAAW